MSTSCVVCFFSVVIFLVGQYLLLHSFGETTCVLKLFQNLYPNRPLYFTFCSFMFIYVYVPFVHLFVVFFLLDFYMCIVHIFM
jgi:hypothetical protein